MRIGALYMVIAGLLLALMGALGKLAQVEASTFQIVFFQFLVGLVWLLPLAIIKRGWKAFVTHHLGLHLIRDVAGIASYFLFFFALPYVELVDVVALNNTGPLFVPLFDWLWLRQRIQRSTLWGPLVGFLGVLLILQPGGAGFHAAQFLALGSGAMMAITFLAMRLLNRSEAPYITLLFYFAIATVVMLPLAIGTWHPLSGSTWLALIGVGLLMSGMQTLLILALGRGQATILSPLIYSAVIWSGLIEWLIFGTTQDWLSWVGIGCVILGGGLSMLIGHLIERRRPPSDDYS